MKRVRKILMIFAIVLVVLIAIPAVLFWNAQRSYAAAHLKAGDRAPEFALPDQNGRTVRLADYLGKKNVVLAFYIKANTPG